MTFAIDDPDLGRITVRPVSLEDQIAIVAEIGEIDLDRGERALRGMEGREFAPLTVTERRAAEVAAQVAEIRRTLIVHGVVRAGVIDPAPPMLDDAIVDAYPPLGMYIRLGDKWTPVAIRRIYELVTSARTVAVETGR